MYGVEFPLDTLITTMAISIAYKTISESTLRSIKTLILPQISRAINNPLHPPG